MLKIGLIITLVILLITFLTYLNPSLTSFAFFSKEDKLVYSSEILDTKILKAEIISTNQIKALIKNNENINLRFFIQVTGDKGSYSYYDTNTLEAKSTKNFIITIDPDKTGNLIKTLTITPYLQLEGKKLIYRFSQTSYQINQQLPETTTQPKAPPSTPPILTAPTTTETTYIYTTGLLASIGTTGNINYYHKDHLGSIRAITNDQGQVIYTSSYEPFGSQFSETGSSEYSYTGKPKDNTGLYYYGARYYDSSIGRFTQLDPILSVESSPYAYVSNNPMKFIDPTGAQMTIPQATFAFDMAFGALYGGIGSKIHGGSFWKGFNEGALGGAIMYTGKNIARHTETFGQPFAGRLIHSLGASMVENTARNENVFSTYRTDIGPIELTLSSEGFDYRFLPASIILGIGPAIGKGFEFKAKESLSSGSFVFEYQPGELGGSSALGGLEPGGVAAGNTIFLSGRRKPTTFAHELTHTLQYRESRLLSDAAEAGLAHTPGLRWTESVLRRTHVSSDIGEVGLSYMTHQMYPYRLNPIEVEAYSGYSHP